MLVHFALMLLRMWSSGRFSSHLYGRARGVIAHDRMLTGRPQ